MKLLNVQTAKSQAESQADFKKKQDKLLDEQISKKIIQLNDLPATYEIKKANLQAEFAALYKDLEEKYSKLLGEVKILEEKLLAGMKPLAEREQYLNEREQIILLRESANNDALLKISGREADLNNQVKAIQAAEADLWMRQGQAGADRQSIDAAAKEIATRRVTLTRDIESFNKTVKETQDKLFDQQKTLELRENALKAERIALDRIKEQIQTDRVALMARRDELEAAWTEFKNIQLNK